MLCSRARRSAEWSPTARFRAQNVRLVTIPCVAGLSHTVDQALDALVLGAERVLAQDGALGLVVELEVHPVDGEVAPTLLGLADELATQPRPGGLRRHRLRAEDLEVGGDPGDGPALLEQVVEAAAAVDVVVGEVELGDPRVAQRQAVLGAVALDQLPLDDPVDLAVDEAQVVGLDGLEAALPEVEGLLDERGGDLAAVDERAGL